MINGNGSEWFATWFDSVHYQKLYAHRDDAEAARFLDGLVGQLGPAAAPSAGPGMWRRPSTRFLASKGLRVTGVDLAASSIKEAKKSEQPRLRFFQHDMRVPFGRQAFDYVFNFFTKVGDFADTSEHRAVVGTWRWRCGIAAAWCSTT